jgi:mRNA interferase RelE/StbE
VSWSVGWTRRAVKDMDKLPAKDATRIRTAVAEFASSGVGDVRKLRGSSPTEWRLRVGEWRVRFTLEAMTLIVLHVRHRGDAYR